MPGIDFLDGKRLSPIGLTTIGGHGEDGMLPYSLNNDYRFLIKVSRLTDTTTYTKSSTFLRKWGNLIIFLPWTYRYVQKLPNGGMVNAFGLTNAGSKKCAKKIARAQERGHRIVPNIYPEFSKGTDRTVEEILGAIFTFITILGRDFWILKLNLSCPNAKEAIDKNMGDSLHLLRVIRMVCPWLKIIVKLSYVHPVEFAEEISKTKLADVIEVINTVPFSLVFPNKVSPLADVGGGGVSGLPIKKMAFDHRLKVRKVVDLPMIYCGGIDHLDIERNFDAGADAIAICTDAAENPKEIAKCLLRHNVQ